MRHVAAYLEIGPSQHEVNEAYQSNKDGDNKRHPVVVEE